MDEGDAKIAVPRVKCVGCLRRWCGWRLFATSACSLTSGVASFLSQLISSPMLGVRELGGHPGTARGAWSEGQQCRWAWQRGTCGDGGWEAGTVSAFLRRCWESVIGLRREQERDSPESPLGMHWGFRFLERSASDSRTRDMSGQPLLAPSFLLPLRCCSGCAGGLVLKAGFVVLL